MRLWAEALDMRACHPADISTEGSLIGVTTPRLRAFTEGSATIE